MFLKVAYLVPLYTCNLPQPENITIATFADDTAILAVGKNIEESTEKVQQATEEVLNWTKDWKIKLNEQTLT